MRYYLEYYGDVVTRLTSGLEYLFESLGMIYFENYDIYLKMAGSFIMFYYDARPFSYQT